MGEDNIIIVMILIYVLHVHLLLYLNILRKISMTSTDSNHHIIENG